MRRIEVLFTFFALLVSSAARDHCVKDCPSTFDPSTLWYVWVIIVFVSVLLGCGCIATCVKIFCRPNKPPVPILDGRSHEVIVVSVDNQSTIHSMSSVSGLIDSRPPAPFANFSPPPYDLYALESLPQYHEALAMPTNASAFIGGKAEDDGEFHQTHASGEESTQEAQQQESHGDTHDNEAFDEEEPPAYRRYSTIADEEFNDIDLDELDPPEIHKEETATNTHEHKEETATNTLEQNI